MTKVIMHGCNGKVGRAITRLTNAQDNIEIVAGVDPYLEVPNTYPVFPNINECNIAADVIIDFSTAPAVRPLIDYSKAQHIPAVICTTGLSEEDIAHLKEN